MIGQTIVFYVTAFLAVVSAVMVITRENPIHSVLWLILNLVSIAVLYLTLRAPFLFAAQMIVYAGAIVVLFLFVVMMLIDKEQMPETAKSARWLTPATFAAAALLTCALLLVAFAFSNGTPMGPAVIGTPTQVGRVLFRDYLLPFEATSLLLMTALVGALYLGRHGAEQDGEGEVPEDADGVSPASDSAIEAVEEDAHARA